MSDLLTTISKPAVQIFAIASMASIGLRYGVEALVGPLRDFWAVVLAHRILPVLGVATNVALMTLVVLTVALNLSTVLGVFGTGAIAASLLFIAGAFCTGWVRGGAFGEHLRDEMALGTAQRNFAAALVVATQAFDAPGVLVMAVVVSLVTMAVLFPAAKLLNRRAHRQSAVA